MKKVLIVMLVLVFAASFAYADERVKLSGEMRVMGYSMDNYTTFNDEDDTDNAEYFNQRFRFGMKINIAEGVSANFRADFAEATWGHGFTVSDFARPQDDETAVGGATNNELHLDRTYLQIDKGLIGLKAGQMYLGTGNSIAVDGEGTAFALDIKPGPAVISLIYCKVDEGGATNDEAGAAQDTNVYGVQAAFKTDAFGAKAFYVMVDDHDAEDEPAVFGVCGNAAVGSVKLNAELDFYMGDDGVEGAAGTDYVGTNLWLNAEAAVGPATVGAHFLYGAGNDDADDEQLNHLTDFGSWIPTSYAVMPGVWDPVVDGLGFGDGQFEAFGDDSGVLMLALYGKAKVADVLTLAAMLGYAEPEEDSNTVTLCDSGILLNLGATYAITEGAAFHLGFNYMSLDWDSAWLGEEDDPMAFLMKLNVKW